MRALAVIGLLGAGVAALTPRVAGAADAGTDAGGKEPTRSVLIWKNAWLQTARSADAPRVRHSGFADAERPAHLKELWSFPLVGDVEGDLVEIETPGEKWREIESTNCYDTPYALHGLKLRLFARRADLVRVTNQPTKARVVALPKDVHAQTNTVIVQAGDPLELHAGIGLVPYGAGRPGVFLASNAEFTFAVEIDDEKTTGMSYGRWPIRYELQKVLAAFPTISRGRFWVRGFEPRKSGRKDGRDVLLTVHESCLDTELAVKKSQLIHPDREGFFTNVPGLDIPVLGIATETAEEKRAPHVRDGATAYWPDGSVAGTVEHGRRLGEPAPASGARPCFRVSVVEVIKHSAPEQTLPICFDKADLNPSK